MTSGTKNTILVVYNVNQGGLDIRTSSNYIVLSDGDGNPRGIFDSSGNLGIGTTSPAQKLHVSSAGTLMGLVQNTASTADARMRVQNTASSFEMGVDATGGYLQETGAYPILFYTNSAERARIDSSGNLLVGTTTANGVVTARQTTLGTVTSAEATNASYNGTVFAGYSTRAASASFDFLGVYANLVGQFRVSGSGVIYAQNTAVQSISDQRLKENIRNATDGLDVITALRTVRFDWKEGYGNDRKDQLGFIAQEVEAVFPEAVSEWQVSKEDETAYKTVGPSALIPVLVKAIQEQQAIIESLKARLDAANL